MKVARTTRPVVQALKKLAREAIPKGLLKSVVEVNRVLDCLWGSEGRSLRERRRPSLEGK